MIDNSNYIRKWLDSEEKKIGPYNFHAFKEKESIEKEKIILILSKKLIEHYVHPKVLKKNLEKLGKIDLANIIEDAFPEKGFKKMGDFGEVLTAEHLSQIHGYDIFHKLRYKTNPEMPLHGEDVVLFRLDDDKISSIAVAESKARQTYSLSVYDEAFEKMPNIKNISKYLRFLRNIYAERDTKRDELILDSLVEYSEDIKLKKFPMKYWAFFISKKGLHNLKKHVTDERDLPTNFNFVGIHIEEVDSVVNEVFRKCENVPESEFE